MKKKAVALLLSVSMVMALNACGKTNEGSVTENTETETEMNTVSSSDIEYNANDYVTLGDYKNMAITLDDDYAVTDQDVKDYVDNNVIANYPYYVDTDKTVVENGDVVNIDYQGLLDGEAFDGGTAKGYDLTIGSHSFIDGFEDGLIGAEVGKETDLNLTFPKDYNSDKLAGKDVVFKVTVNSIKVAQDMSYDTLNDEYVAYLSGQIGASYTSVADMTNDIKSYLEQKAGTDKNKALRSATLDKIAEVCTVNSLPDGLLDARMDEYVASFVNNYCKDTSLDDYLASTYNTTEADFRSQVSTELESELNTQLILEAIVNAEGIEFDEDGFNQYVSGLISNYGYDSEDTLYTQYGSNADTGKAYLKKIYLCNKALNLIMEGETVDFNTEEAAQNTETPVETGSTEQVQN